MAKKGIKIAIYSIFVLCVCISLINIYRWYKWYKERKVIICLDIDYFLTNNISPEKITEIFRHTGIQKFVVDINFLLAKKFELPSATASLVIKIYDTKLYNVEQLLKFVEDNKDKIFSIIYLKAEKLCNENKSCLEHSCRRVSEKEILEIVKKYKFVKFNFEGIESDKIPYFLSLRAFEYDLNQISNLQNKYCYKNVVVKIKKAIFERSCSVVYIIPSTFLSFEDNFKVISEICKKVGLQRLLYKNQLLDRFISLNIKWLDNLLVLLLSIILPVYIFKNYLGMVKKTSTPAVSFFLLNSIFLLIGVTFWGLLVNYEYISLQRNIFGIKLMLVLPVLVMFFFLFDKKEIYYLLNYQVKVKDFLLFCLSLAIFFYLILRSGNVSKIFILPGELKIREVIESYILYRPRFKDIFFAQPLLTVSLRLLYDRKYYDTVFTKLLLTISVFAYTFIINTFLHIHTPVWYCILRSILGIVLGFACGEILWHIYNITKK